MRESFAAGLKEAMKAGDKLRVGTLRLVQAAIKDKEIEARAQSKTLSDDDVLGVLQKMIKSRQESLAIYEKAGREDLAAQERGEIAIIMGYLPQPLSDEEASAAIDKAIADSGASGMKDMGKVVGALKQAYAGRMDFAKASAEIKARLSR